MVIGLYFLLAVVVLTFAACIVFWTIYMVMMLIAVLSAVRAGGLRCTSTTLSPSETERLLRYRGYCTRTFVALLLSIGLYFGYFLIVLVIEALISLEW
jgi:hypothetical protein